jgi:hypothetical protein
MIVNETSQSSILTSAEVGRGEVIVEGAATSV